MAKEVKEAVAVEDRGNKMLHILKTRVENAVAAELDGRQRKLPKKQIDPLKAATKAAVDDHNKLVEKLYYRKLYADYKTDALYEALRSENCIIPGAIAAKFKENADTGAISAEIVKDQTKRVDLSVFRAETAPECFHSEDWFDKADNLSKVMTNKSSKRLHNDPVYQDTLEESKQLFGFEINPDDPESLVKAFQAVVDSIIWRGEDESHNEIIFGEEGLEYFERGFGSVDRKSTNGVKVISPAKCQELICCRINVVLNALTYNLAVAK